MHQSQTPTSERPALRQNRAPAKTAPLLTLRASQLELTAHHLGCRSLAARIAAAAPDRPWQTRWSRGRRATLHQVLTGHVSSVNAVAAWRLPDGTPVIIIISGGDDRTVRVWRLADGTPVGEPLAGPDDEMQPSGQLCRRAQRGSPCADAASKSTLRSRVDAGLPRWATVSPRCGASLTQPPPGNSRSPAC